MMKLTGRKEFILKDKKIIIAIVLNILIICVIIAEGLILNKNASTLTVTKLFIVFGLFPMILAFFVPFLSTLIYCEKKILFINGLFSLFLYIYNFWIIDAIFNSDVLNHIYENSGIDIKNIETTSGSDIGSMITTAVMILALSIFGTFLGRLIVRKIVHKKIKGAKERAYT